MALIYYGRLSPPDREAGQQLEDASQAGFSPDHVFIDESEPGLLLPLHERPVGGQLLNELKPGDTLLVRWVDRLGRSYKDAAKAVSAVAGKGVTLQTIIGGLTISGAESTAPHEAFSPIVAFMSALADANADASKLAQKEGIAAARREGTKYLGRRPTFNRDTLTLVRQLLEAGTHPVAEIARMSGLTRPVVVRIRDNPEAAEVALGRWEG